MKHVIDLQIACTDPLPINEQQLQQWVEMALNQQEKPTEVTLRLVSEEEITVLNATYRKKNKATNVLAFPSQIPEIVQLDHAFLGDVIICPAVLKKEALSAQIKDDAHWAHIVIHGVLHLLGYDHINDEDEREMQDKEIMLLQTLGFANPYLYKEHCID